MPVQRLLIANRGEIAVRIARTAAEMGIFTIGIFSQDDAGAAHIRKTDAPAPLTGSGPAAYLGIEQVVATATAMGADAVHPGTASCPKTRNSPAPAPPPG